ncbi:VOC family protein [Alkalibacillus salilacus]|uniref:Glyoxalase superfamily protein PhnB n=1 Tax=Alkalibacillus salilacus TaxID=284582 RepID=A0ABT9VFI5_9BACI|nr:VOC family protein [Alkalibacillus salilacus]MDQ0159728.1 putative glyoxalase superfamily protein PhnB [Alkalibacillus salilacus]
MGSIELDMVVSDSLEALKVYEYVFDLEEIKATNLPKGQNEVLFTLYNMQFHLLDENREAYLIAPTPEDPKTSWVNVTVDDINKTYQFAMDQECTEIQPVTEMADMGISNAIFMDPFGYVWMLHEVHEETTFEERAAMWEESQEQ